MQATPPTSIVKAVTIASIGSALEMYDFVIYIFFAPVISKQFFPEKNALASLLLTFGVFAIGFFCRTIGAFVFGYFGDTHGRKKTLIYTMTLMVVPMLVLTFLPGYQQIGIMAPIILTLMRCFQGLAVGGEFSGSLTLIAEYALPAHRGYACSWVVAALNVGILLASLISMLITNIFIEHFHLAWGWRIAFFIGCLLALLIAYIRRHFEESPLFASLLVSNLHNKPPRPSLKEEVLLTWRVMMTIIGAALTVGMIMFFPTFLQNFSLMNAPLTVSCYNAFFLMILCAAIPFFGKMSDKLGRKPIMMAGLISILLFIYPIAECLSNASTVIEMLFACALLALIISPVLSVFGSFMAESFPTYFRARGIGLAYNIPFTLFTGTFPLFSLLIVKHMHSIHYQYVYIMLLAVIALISLCMAPETRGKALSP